MNIYFTCSTSGLETEYKKYKKLLEHIENLGHTILYPWIDEAYKNIKQNTLGDLELYYHKKVDAISESDLAIAEGSIKSFTVGHQITIALNKAIPVLLLYKIDPTDHQGPYAEGIKSKWLHKYSYKNDNEALEIIENFLDTYSGKEKKYRFHLVITQQENRILDNIAQRTNKTKTQVIRDLIKKTGV